MNYSGNMPDWHQFNVSQSNEVVPPTQNVNSGHLTFIPGVNSPAFNTLTLSSDSYNKHQNDSNFNARNYQSFNNGSNGPNISNNTPLVSMMQMQNCISHYGSPNTRNPMLDNSNASVDHRNTTVGSINDEIGYRSNQVPFNGPIGHLNGPNCNLNTSSVPGSVPGPGFGAGHGSGSRANSGSGPEASPGTGTGSGPSFGAGSRHGPVHGSGTGPGNMGPRNTNISSLHPGKAGPPSFIPCKGLCCNSDPNINYQQWEKFGSYQNNTSYRDNMHVSGYQMENRHFGNNCNFRKDNLESKETMGSVLSNASSVDHRRNFADYKYHKDHLMHRNYSAPSGMFHGYSMQNYNYSTEHQKYPYPVKEHSKTSNMNNISSSGILKHQEQMIAQQKFNNKQFQYQNNTTFPKGMSALNVNGNMTPSSSSSSQNPYFNSQFSRNIPAEMPHECQEATESTGIINRIQAGSFMHNSPQHQAYQHKIAMQKFSMENHLRELSRIPGYQSHPKYKECISRYRELLKLQQPAGYQNPVQQVSFVTAPTSATTVPPINLQFDQNGMLINSNYLPDDFSKLQHTQTAEQSSENMEKQTNDPTIRIVNEKCQEKQELEQSKIALQSEQVPSPCAESLQKQNQFPLRKDLNRNELKGKNSENRNFDRLSTDATKKTMMQQKASKEFANKPDLDVRQFLANWDETDDEEATTSNLPETVLNTTPVVVVSYENVDLSSRASQTTESFKRNSLCLNEITVGNDKEIEADVIAAQDCLTISYPSSESVDITESSKRTIGEGVMKPGSIIHCISNGPDEIPTIHIVDNLEISNILGVSDKPVAETLEKSKAISFFKETANNGAETMVIGNTKQHNKNQTHTASPNYDATLGNVNKSRNLEDSSISKTIQTAAVVSINNQEPRALSTTIKSNLDITDNLDFKKQNNFVSEESHNPDDISLPDLPTSECTPISTTLNTPIHSDSEESSQNIEDLSMSTNPIEVMQNSPVISFTQSPIKMEPYGQLNSEEKVKNKPVDTLELDLQKENHYKNNVDRPSYDESATLGNFNFCAGQSKAKSSETTKDKQVKSFDTDLTRKKVFLMNNKDDSRISDTYAALTSIEYELEVEEEKTAENEEDSKCKSSNSEHEEKRKGARRSTNSVESVVEDSDPVVPVDSFLNIIVPAASNVTLTRHKVSNDEIRVTGHEKELPEKQEIKSTNRSIPVTSPTLSEVDLNAEEMVKGTIVWENKYVEKSSEKVIKIPKKNVEHSKLPERLDMKKCCENNGNSSRGQEYSVCHATFRSKNYTAAVIKDNIILIDEKSHGSTEKDANVYCEELPEIPARTDDTNEFSKEAGSKKHVSHKLIPVSYGMIRPEVSKTYELLEKDPKMANEDVTCASKERRLLKEHSKTKDKSYEACNTRDKKRCTNRKEHSPKVTNEGSAKIEDNISYCENDAIGRSRDERNNDTQVVIPKICLDQNLLSRINLETLEETKNHTYLKNFIRNTTSNFGIQVANVNLQIKENETERGLILDDKEEEHVKDPLDGIKIEINVSCTERNLKGQEQNKQLLKLPLYETENSRPYPVNTCLSNMLDCQQRLVNEQKLNDNSEICKKAYKTIDNSSKMTETVGRATSAVDTNVNSTPGKRSGRNLSEASESDFTGVTFEEVANLTSRSQNLNKLLHNNTLCTDTPKAEVIENTNYSHNNDDTIKSNRAISSTAITNTNDKMLIKMRDKFDGENSGMNTEGDEVIRMQKQSSNLAECYFETAVGASRKSDEKESLTVSQMLKDIRKSGDVNFAESNSKSLNALNTLDLNLDKFDYKKYSRLNLDRVYARVDGIEEFDNSCIERSKKPKINNVFEDCDMFQSTSGYINPTFSSINKPEDLHTVPVYTTKDGKISYSPNRKFTYHELMMEARKREGFPSTRRQHYTDAWNNYCNSKFRKFYKKKRHHDLSNKKKHEFKNIKYLYERKGNGFDEFSAKSHAKYKDYVHSIPNVKAVWSDYCKINQIYTSSGSDEEVVDRTKSRIPEISSCKKIHVISSKVATIAPNSSKTDVTETVTGDLNMKIKDKESGAFDIDTRKDTSACSEGIQSIQLPFIHNNETGGNCRNADRDNVSDIPTSQAHPSFAIHPNYENGEGQSKVEGSTHEFLVNSYDFRSEGIQSNENKNINDECADINIDEKSSCAGPGKDADAQAETNRMPVLKNHTNLNNRTSFLENENKSESSYHTSMVEDMKTEQVVKSASEIHHYNCSLTKEFSELTADSIGAIEPELQANLKVGEFKNTFTETAETSRQQDITETDERLFIKTKECILECEEENVRIVEKTQVSAEESVCQESANRDLRENAEFFKYDEPNSSSLSNVACTTQEECESRLVQINRTNEESVRYISAKNNENINGNCRDSNSAEAKKCEVSSVNLSKDTVRNKTENIAEDLVVSKKNEIEFVPATIKDVTEDRPVISLVKPETALNLDNSVEKEMPVLNMYCTVKSSPTRSVECRENEAEESKQKGEEYQLTVLESYKSLKLLQENDTDMKAIPKLVIKKADNVNPKSGCLFGDTDSENSTNMYDSKILNDIRPKIPKMIIIKNRSRSATPTIDILERAKSSSLSEHADIGVDVDNSYSELHTSKNNYKNRVPRVTIKLEDISSKDLKLYLKRKAAQKNDPRMAIKRIKTKENKISSMKFKRENTSEIEPTDSDNDENEILQESLTSSTEIMPKLKLKNEEEEKCLSSEKIRVKDASNLKVPSKKIRRPKEEDTKECVICDDGAAINDGIKKKYPQCISEKIPKVIIKRTQIGTEFKCEISKSKKSLALETSKWQPKVKLQRLQVLDFMVKDLKQSNVTSKDKTAADAIDNNIPVCPTYNIHNIKYKDSRDEHEVKLCRSSSASSLSPVSCKQRRLSDCGYMKTDTKLTADFINRLEEKRKALDKNEPSSAKTINNESEKKSLKGNNETTSFSQCEAMDCSRNGASEDEMEDVRGSFFTNRFVNENNDLIVTEKEYSDETKESITCMMPGIAYSGNFDDNGNSIIKVDSSDESQTTIELLPASPDSSEEDELKRNDLERRNRLRAEHAIPTRLELELGLIDNDNTQHSCVIAPNLNEFSSIKIEKYDHEDARPSSWNTFAQSKRIPLENEETRSPEKKSNDYFYCNDLLVKEVLAAKETLKKCLTKSANEDTEEGKSRPKILAERKQGLSFSFRDIKESCCNNDNINANMSKNFESTDQERYKSPEEWSVKETENKHSSVEKEIEFKDSQDEIGPYSVECSTTSTCGYTNVPELTTISLKATKKFARPVTNDTSNVETDISYVPSKHVKVDEAKKLYREKLEKRTTAGTQEQKDDDNSNETKSKEDNMPLLVPEFALNFDSNSDRDSSRSPPVITNQEDADNAVEEAKNVKTKIIIPMVKVEEEKKHSCKDYEMTIADIISQLAFHEKATVNHKRYCNLCERWFPTTSRHRRHLSGYQHRSMELSQRKSIHALFILFTGKPCPRLLPANVMRNDCSVGELTPLQIAVQDIAKYTEHTQEDPKTKE